MFDCAGIAFVFGLLSGKSDLVLLAHNLVISIMVSNLSAMY